MNTAVIAAIAAASGSVLTALGKIIVDIIHAKKEPDQSDLELKDDLEREKDKNNKAIAEFTEIVKALKGSVEDMDKNLSEKIEDMYKRIEEYQEETREINKSELRHSITQIYYDNCQTKQIDLNTKKDLCSLYEAYTSIGGNSFVHELYEEMMDWDIV